MNYIVNPMWFYLISLFEEIDTATLIFCVLTPALGYIIPLLFDLFDIYDIQNWKPWFKKWAIAFGVFLFFTILIPDRKDMEKMLIASYATEDNISAATNYGKDLVDYIFDKVNGANEEEEKK